MTHNRNGGLAVSVGIMRSQRCYVSIKVIRVLGIGGGWK